MGRNGNILAEISVQQAETRKLLEKATERLNKTSWSIAVDKTFIFVCMESIERSNKLLARLNGRESLRQSAGGRPH